MSGRACRAGNPPNIAPGRGRWYTYRLDGGGAYQVERIRPGVYLVHTPRGADYLTRAGTRTWTASSMPGITADSLRRMLAILHERNIRDGRARRPGEMLA